MRKDGNLIETVQWRQERKDVPEQALIQRLASWSANLSVTQFDAEVTRAATRAIVDTVGVMMAGATKSLSQRVMHMVEQDCQPGHATMFTGGASRKPTGAAFANGVAAHVLDFDDTCYDGILHASCVILPAVLACAEEADATTADILAAFVAGSEVTYALGRALTDVFWNGWWTTATLGSIGAAAGAARALDLGEAGSAHAMAIATSLTFGTRTLLGTDTNPIGAGTAAQAGVRAALLARAGASGPLSAIEHPIGLAAVFNRGVLDRTKLSEIGQYYALRDSGIAFKAYPACSGTQAACQAVQELLERHCFKARDVKTVTCRVAPLVAENLRYPNPANLTEAQFSLPFAVGCLLTYGEFSVRQLKDEALNAPRLRAEMAKVTMLRADDIVGADDVDRFPEAAAITVEFHDGRRIDHKVLAARGMPIDPLSDVELRDKFMNCAVELVPSALAESIYDRLGQLGRGGYARELFADLRARLAEQQA